MRAESKMRKTDEQNSKIVTQWLEENIYPKLVTEYHKYDDIVMQTKGIDCTFKFKDILYKCDEKAATAYINKPLHTFAFELSFINRSGYRQMGWFLNDVIETDLYGLVWIDKAAKSPLTNTADIQEIETAYVRKSDILKCLASMGWTLDKIMAKEMMIRQTEGKVYMGNVYENGCKFAYSGHLVEKPVNILIPRKVLVDMRLF